MLRSLAQAVDDHEAYARARAGLCRMEGDAIVLAGPSGVIDGEYEIPLDRCDDETKILGWVLHLAEKRWVTKDILVRFIGLASLANGVPIDRRM